MNNAFQRTCLACREKKHKNEMLRVVKNKENQIIFDKQQIEQGRGAYVCLNDNCITKICKNKLLNKTFKTNVNDEIYIQLKNMR